MLNVWTLISYLLTPIVSWPTTTTLHICTAYTQHSLSGRFSLFPLLFLTRIPAMLVLYKRILAITSWWELLFSRHFGMFFFFLGRSLHVLHVHYRSPQKAWRTNLQVSLFTTLQKLKNSMRTITPTTRRLIWHQDVLERKTRSVQTHHPHPLSPGPCLLHRALHNSYRNLQNGSAAVFLVQRHLPGQVKHVRAWPQRVGGNTRSPGQQILDRLWMVYWWRQQVSVLLFRLEVGNWALTCQLDQRDP